MRGVTGFLSQAEKPAISISPRGRGVSRELFHVRPKGGNVAFHLLDPTFQTLAETRVVGGIPTNRADFDAPFPGVFIKLAENIMVIAHGGDSANWHDDSQVPINTLPNGTPCRLNSVMSADFRKALIWHMDHHGTAIADLVKATGVSRDVINKLKAREGSSTTAENAMLIAAYYGKSVNDFVALREASEATRTAAMLDLLQPEERRLLQAQIRGLLSERGRE